MSAFPDFQLDGSNIILAPQGFVATMPFPVKLAIRSGEVLIVLLDIPVGSIENENVFGIRPDGTTAWQIERLPHVYDDSPYTNITITDGEVKAYNWDGDEVVLDPATGKSIGVSYKK
ncbi:MAG TPA: hypothetical protein PKD92_01290 [Novosphingobium sp.]|nr:hypothetical protein [Novosphingobium sp.]HMP55191.1 hypothetical protein [Novosphingobium sp.]